MSAEPPASSPKPADAGKWIRFALVALPAGTIVLGALSFVIYFEKKEREAEITYRHALALRRDINAADIERHMTVLQEAAKLPAEERRKTVAGYLESTLSPENMGYEVRRDEWHTGGQERVNMLAGLRGTKRPQDVVVVLASYGGEMDAGQIAGLAVWLSLAQAVTGDPKIKTVQFSAVDASDGETVAVSNLLADMRDQKMRASHVHWLAVRQALPAGEAAGPFTGAKVESHPLAESPAELKAQAEAVQRVIEEAAGRF